MKKYYILSFLTIASIALISWGFKGHQAIATIAEHHLTPNAKASIESLLGGQSMADVANWADEVRNQPEYKNTVSWHYLNVPSGLSYKEFTDAVSTQQSDNIYIALIKAEHVLTHEDNSIEKRVEALKLIIHLVGDAHQPMHVSHKEDKGGNTIQVQFDGRGTNLHSVWDSKLIDKQGYTYGEMAKEYDEASPEQIKAWQSAEPMQWLWESYQISEKLYSEVEKNNKLDENYYKSNIPIVQQRIEQAGIRLAGILNTIFKKTTIVSVAAQPICCDPIAPDVGVGHPDPVADTAYLIVPIQEVNKHLDTFVSVKAKVFSVKDLGNMTLVNLGGEYPNQPLTVVLKGKAKEAALDLQGKTIYVVGKIIDYKGKPEIIVTDPKNISMVLGY